MNSRREFLLTAPALALTPSLASAATPSPQPKGFSPPSIPFDFDKAAFDAILSKPAKHKQCFGATKIDDGGVIDSMVNSMNAYDEFLGEGAGSMHTVAVLYHGAAIAIALSNAVWNDILLPIAKKLPPHLREQFADAVPGKGNPYLAKIYLPGIVARGSSFFVCHNAIAGFAGLAADALKQPVTKVHAAIMAGIVPGALAVPAGVMAINACQEAKFTYIQSSL